MSRRYSNDHHYDPPDVPLPAGAHVLIDWHDECRSIGTPIEPVDAGVAIDAPQLPTGALLSRPGCNPRVFVYQRSSPPKVEWMEGLELSAAGARRLARAPFAAADQLDGWEGAEST
jgi:hypothetical protein